MCGRNFTDACRLFGGVADWRAVLSVRTKIKVDSDAFAPESTFYLLDYSNEVMILTAPLAAITP